MKKIILIFLALFCSSPFAFAQLDFGKLVNPGPLSSPHSSLEGIKNCSQCHATASGVPDQKCLDCHKEIQSRIQQRKGYHARVTGTCVKCHSEHKGVDYDVTGLSRLPFDHTDTGWPLIGKHKPLACPSCHTQMRKNIMTGAKTNKKTYLGNSSECKSCHKDPHQSRSPSFQKCYKCHDSENWKMREKASFSHNKEAKFKLTGSHVTTSCVSCHTKKVWAPMSMACVSCHKDPHNGRFGKECEKCHNTKNWKEVNLGSSAASSKKSSSANVGIAAPSLGAKANLGKTAPSKSQEKSSTFDHDTTAFPLTGLHKEVTCKGCHGPSIGKMQNFQDCVGCHQNPHGNQFKTIWTPKPCSSCHQTTGFKNLILDHNKDTRYELLGKHTSVGCNQCHTNGRYRWLSGAPDCNVCHADPHNGQFKNQTCASCHTYEGFKVKKFDHNKTPFPLVGKHEKVACESCHVNNKFSGLSHACSACHNDFHKGELGTECERCHSPANGFNDVDFNHNRTARFRLDGEHLKNQCNQCHWNYKYKFKKFDCSSCHIDVHKGSFGAECDKCHTTSGFSMKEGFHEFGSFRIEGIHNKLDCNFCHNPKAPARARAMECATCHRDPHMGSLSNECSSCHRQISWLPTTFRHNQTGFDLTGAHRFLSCDQCHYNRIFGGLPNECVFCHSKDFNPNLPAHIGAPTTCSTCHFTFGFRPAKR